MLNIILKENQYKSLQEALPISVAKPYVKAWKETGGPQRYNEIFGNDERGRPRYRIVLPLYKSKEIKEIKLTTYDNNILKNVKDFLENNEYTDIDLLKNNCKDKNGNIRKINRLLISKNFDLSIHYQKILDKFKKNEVNLLKLNEFAVVISRHPYDIAGMSTGREWESCMTIETPSQPKGSNSRFVMTDVKEGTIVAYLVRKKDINIEKPFARLLIKPFINVQDENDVLLVSSYIVYGLEVIDGFKETVDKWLEEVQKPYGVDYKLLSCLYGDGFETFKTFPQNINSIETFAFYYNLQVNHRDKTIDAYHLIINNTNYHIFHKFIVENGYKLNKAETLYIKNLNLVKELPKSLIPTVCNYFSIEDCKNLEKINNTKTIEGENISIKECPKLNKIDFNYKFNQIRFSLQTQELDLKKCINKKPIFLKIENNNSIIKNFGDMSNVFALILDGNNNIIDSLPKKIDTLTINNNFFNKDFVKKIIKKYIKETNYTLENKDYNILFYEILQYIFKSEIGRINII